MDSTWVYLLPEELLKCLRTVLLDLFNDTSLLDDRGDMITWKIVYLAIMTIKDVEELTELERFAARLVELII